MSDTTQPDEVSHLYCWRDSTLVCNPGCRAYDVNAPKDSKDDSSRCELLRIGTNVARNLGRIAEALSGRGVL